MRRLKYHCRGRLAKRDGRWRAAGRPLRGGLEFSKVRKNTSRDRMPRLNPGSPS